MDKVLVELNVTVKAVITTGKGMDKVLVKLNVTVKAVITTGLYSKREDDQINARGSRVTDIGGGSVSSRPPISGFSGPSWPTGPYPCSETPSKSNQ